jgi:hypothetical protein
VARCLLRLTVISWYWHCSRALTDRPDHSGTLDSKAKTGNGAAAPKDKLLRSSSAYQTISTRFETTASIQCTMAVRGVTERRRETRLEGRMEKGSGREKSTKGFEGSGRCQKRRRDQSATIPKMGQIADFTSQINCLQRSTPRH